MLVWAVDAYPDYRVRLLLLASPSDEEREEQRDGPNGDGNENVERQRG